MVSSVITYPLFQLLLNLDQELVVHEIVPFLALQEIGRLDCAVTNHELRSRYRNSVQTWPEILRACEPGHIKASRLFSQVFAKENLQDAKCCEWAVGRNVAFEKLELTRGDAVSTCLLEKHLSECSSGDIEFRALILSPGEYSMTNFELMICGTRSSCVPTLELNNMSKILINHIFTTFTNMRTLAIKGFPSCELIREYNAGPVKSVTSLRLEKGYFGDGRCLGVIFPNLTCLNLQYIKFDHWATALSCFTTLKRFSRSATYSEQSTQNFCDTMIALAHSGNSLQAIELQDSLGRTRMPIQLLADDFHNLIEFSVESPLDILWLQQLSQNCPLLQVLHVNIIVSEYDDLETLDSEASLRLTYPHVRDLGIQGKVSARSLNKILTSMPNLLELCIALSSSYDNIMTKISALCPRLQVIKTTNCWSDSVFVSLFHPNNCLHTLHYCNSKNVSELALEAIGLFGKHLKFIRLDNCSTNLHEWFDYLLKCPQLRRLDLNTAQCYANNKAIRAVRLYRSQRPWVTIAYNEYF